MTNTKAHSGPDAAEREKAKNAELALRAVTSLLNTAAIIFRALVISPWRALCGYWVLNLWLPVISPGLSVTYWQTFAVVAILGAASAFATGLGLMRLIQATGASTKDATWGEHIALPGIVAGVNGLAYLLIYLPFAHKAIP